MKNSGRIVFWVVSPFVFAGFFRLFFLFFYFIYGQAVLLLVGEKFKTAVLVSAVLTSLFFALCVLVLLYRGFVKHVLEKK